METLQARLSVEGIALDTFPIFGDDIKLQLTRESDQIFRREKLDGTFRFVGKDFDIIAGCSANKELTLNLYRNNEFVGKGTFYKTDCRMDYDNKICEVSLTTTDKYEKIMNGLNNKYNLVKLAPLTERAALTRRTVLQLYVKGEKTISNVFGGAHFTEQVAQEVNEGATLRDTYHFGHPLPLMYMQIHPFGGVPDDAQGLYQLSGITQTQYVYTFTFTNSRYYRIEAVEFAIGFRLHLQLTLKDPNGAQLGITEYDRDEFFVLGEREIEFKSSLTSGIVTATGMQYFQGELFARMLTPVYYSSGFPRPTEDITGYNSNYEGVIPIAPEELLPYIHSESYKSSTPTEWGIDSQSLYFTAPVLTPTQKIQGIVPIPFGQSHWEYLSTWIMMDRDFITQLDRWNQFFTLKDAYSVANCIKVLVKEIDPSITFEETSAYSIFLSPKPGDVPELIDAYPFPRTRESRLFLTPITNIKKTRYEQAAQRGDITLKQIFDMLRNVYRCYWWIDSDNRLRIEHITYIKNGGFYLDKFSKPLVDLTKISSLPTAKKWGFNTNTLVGDKSRCPARYEFGWGDAQTEQFNGYAIDLADKYIDHSKTEKITIENIITDLDYVIINPNGVSDDLFALFEANVSSGQVGLSFVRLSNSSPMYRLQNGYCSFLFAEAHYYPYDLGGWKAKANGEELSVIGTKPFKSQDISFPITLEQARSVEYIRTDMGIGEMDSISIEADSLHANAKVYHSEKQDPTNDSVVLRAEEVGVHRRDYYVTNNASIPMKATLTKKVGGSPREIFSVTLQPYEDRLLEASTNSIYTLLNAEENAIVEVGRPNITYGTEMTCDISYGQEQGKDYCQIEFDGHKEEQPRYEDSWGMCSIYANKDLRVTCVYSTEYNYDIAWANTTPCTSSDEALHAQYQASGEGTFSFNLPKGESICLGYTKDVDTYEYADIVRFTIQEL